MATGPVRQQDTTIPGKSGFANILKESPPTVRMPAPSNKRDPKSSTFRAPVDTISTQDAPVNATEKEKVAETKEPAEKKLSSENEKETRQRAWGELNQAAKLKKEAEELKRQADSFAQVKNAPQKLQAIAKALGMTSDELLMQLNNERMSVPTNKVLTPEEQAKAEALEYKEKLTQVEERQLKLENYTAMVSHINKVIMPHLVKNPEEFEFCHKYGIDKCATEVYNECNRAHQNKEQFSELEVLREFELQLYNGWKENIEAAKDTKKANEYFGKQPKKEAEKVLGETATTNKAAKELETALEYDPAAKRVQKKSKVPAGVDMNQLATSQNKLSGEVRPGNVYDKEERKKRLLQGI